MIERIRDSVARDDGTLILSGAFKMETGSLKNDLMNRRQQIANFGRGQLQGELARQQRSTR